MKIVGQIFPWAVLATIAFFIIRDEVRKKDAANPRNHTGIIKQGYGDSIYVIYQRIDSVYYEKPDIDPSERP
jgi:hypothetical protein